jgi:hypothetical protein
MKRSLQLLILMLAVFTAVPALAQTTLTWQKVAVELNYVTTTAPIMVRWGTGTGTTSTGVNCALAPGCWIQSTALSTPLSNAFLSCCWLNGSDPAPGLVKELDVLEVSTVQTLTVNNIAVTVPALAVITPPAPAVYTLTFTPGHVYPASFTSVAVIPSTPAAAILALFPLAPSMFVGSALSNFSEDLMLNGMLMHCTFGAFDATGRPFLNCIPAPIPK